VSGQPTTYTGYWAATALAPFLVRPIAASVMVTASSNPLDLFNFQEMIDEVSAEFDQSAAKAGYTVPIPSTATQAFKVALRVTRQGAVADALRLIYTGPDQKYVDRYEAAFQAALKAILAGDLPLPGAGESGGPIPVWAGVASSMFFASMGIALTGRPQDF
jgi:hypothetical protein